MSKPLTIGELKTLQVGDWVWVEYQFPNEETQKRYYQIEANGTSQLIVYLHQFGYLDYGTKWLAYKNKEQAEAKGEIVELPCEVGDTVYYVHEIDDDNIYYTITAGTVKCISIESDLCEVLVHYEGGLTFWHIYNDFGNEVFTDKQQAEKRLAELKGAQQ